MAATTRTLLDSWLRIWNGQIDLIDSAVHPDFTANFPGIEPYGRDNLRRTIIEHRARFDLFAVRRDLEPIEQGDFAAGRWIAVGMLDGESTYWVGHSIFRIRDAMIINHWEASVQLQHRPAGIPP